MNNNRNKIPFDVMVAFVVKIAFLLAAFIFAMTVMYNVVADRFGSGWGVASLLGAVLAGIITSFFIPRR